jgi:hypothetical protein
VFKSYIRGDKYIHAVMHIRIVSEVEKILKYVNTKLKTKPLQTTVD